eukprot:TRINITY_DN47721_c1_g1_i1.p1 TRINITY_DN47721_c1_g1~~TRINITY_DN47721_c1_g1_i1.p1  ORF type:complete len:422 (+),score=127.91 TRINITY_DN47721_c1_g1_i1:171-1436(+)
MGDNDFGPLLRFLDKQRESPVINLGFAGLGDEGVAQIATYVKDNPFVQYLDLRGNNITAVGAATLAKAVRVNRSLKGLNLKCNRIGEDPAGVDVLCNVLASNLNIGTFDLSYNKVDLQGCKRLSEMITENAAIVRLDLSWNQFGHEGGLAFLAGLKKNRTLHEAKLTGSNIGGELLHEIEAKLRLNQNEAKKNIIPAKVTAALIAALEKPDPEVGSDEEKAKKKYVAFIRENPSKPIDQKTREDMHDLQKQLLVRHRAAMHLEERALYQQIADYSINTLKDTAFHGKEQGDAEERERLATEAFLEREKRYTREIRQTEIDLQVSMKERDKLEYEIAYRQKELKRHIDEHDKSIIENENIKEESLQTERNMKQEVAKHREDVTILEGKLALQQRDLEMLEEENERLKVHVKGFQRDINDILA